MELTILDVALSALRWRRRIATFVAICVVGAGTIIVCWPRKFTAVASFVPAQAGSVSSLGGLAAQFGVQLPGADPTQSPDFYAELLRSRSIQGGVVDKPYLTADGNRKLAEVWDEWGGTDSIRREKAIADLDDATSIAVSKKTGIVSVSVEMPEARLAYDVATEYLALLTAFNLESRSTQASAERRFVEGRVTAIQQELLAAEQRVEQFLSRNHDYRNSPSLTFEFDRLSRDVAVQQQTYMAIVQAYEQARIEEVRDTPVLTMIQSPEVPPRPDSRLGFLKLTLVAFFALILGLGVAIWRDGLQVDGRPVGAKVEELLSLVSALRSELWYPLARWRSWLRRRQA